MQTLILLIPPIWELHGEFVQFFGAQTTVRIGNTILIQNRVNTFIYFLQNLLIFIDYSWWI